ncbi:MAG: pilus assembly protein N-terminal domain-containing protein [Bryobacterales bacterium]|nr:pilus assembly protein N-terminal domain-containing protein [Bryobacterales bacterium]
MRNETNSWSPALYGRRLRCLMAVAICVLGVTFTATAAENANAVQNDGRTSPRDLFVMAGKSIVVQTPSVIQRVVVSDPKIAEALPVTQQELVLHGRAEGETSLILWTAGGGRVLFDLKVQANKSKWQEMVDGVRQELRTEFPDSDLDVRLEGEDPDPLKRAVYVRGTVGDMVGAQRALSIASVIGKPVNLIRVMSAEAEPQILLRVKFANVERTAVSELGANLFSTGATGTVGQTSTGQFFNPLLQIPEGRPEVTFSDALNVFLFRPDLNLGATIRLLQQRRLAEVLAEPNLLAINGKPASFLAGGEFPYPVLQGGGAGLGQITIRFREFGIRVNFVPTLTSRGTIRLAVEPEVSSLDFANGLAIQGIQIPALSVRRVKSEVELEDGQSFVIAGLLDNRVSENLQKIPGLGDIPLLGKLFQSRSRTKNNSEVLILVTPELVRPMQKGARAPELEFPVPFLEGAPTEPKSHPSIEETGPAPLSRPKVGIPYETVLEEYEKFSKQNVSTGEQEQNVLQFVPAVTSPSGGPVAPSGGGGGGGN